MADPQRFRPAPGEIPTDPGVYRFRDEHGRVIYVGKAKSLRPRLSSYFQDPALLHERTNRMLRTAAGVEWTVVRTEVEALQLEYSWIKEDEPRFNIKYRDDKSYPYLAVTMAEEFPRAQVMRGAKKKGTRYFGPFAHAWAIRETLDLALRVFPIRTCSAGVFRRAHQVGRPCLLGYIDKCSAPCVGRIDAQGHRQIAEEFCAFMAGDSARFLKRLEQEMRSAAADLEFEHAARLRDDIAALEKVLEKSAVVFADDTDADVFGLEDDELEVAVQVFHVRGGRIRGQRGWVAEKEAEGLPEILGHLLQEVYGSLAGDEIPREVLVPVLPEGADSLEAWLSGLRGSRVRIRVPRRGDKRTLMETVARNATQSLARHKVARAGDLTARSQALQQIQEALSLDDSPLRIECFDISHVQGTQVVGSMVVFEDGLARKSEYRRFIVRGDEGAGVVDDTAAMREVISRRLHRLGQVEPPGRDEETGRPARFAYPPNLIVVDGGAPQVNAVQRVLDDRGVVDIAVIGLAKRLEEVWIAGEDFPVLLPRSSEGLYLLQRVRDEAHRFALAFHRQRRSKAMTASQLDGIPGLGEVKRKALLKAFGSVKRIRAASLEELQEVPGVGPTLAAAVAARLGSETLPVPAINITTGEVLDDADH